MIFVTANSCRTQLENLTQYLLAAFPGSTVYQHTDIQRVPYDMLNTNVDAVFLEAENGKNSGVELMQLLHQQKPSLPVFIISASASLREEAEAAGADGYFVLSEDEPQLEIAEQLIRERNTAAANSNNTL